MVAWVNGEFFLLDPSGWGTMAILLLVVVCCAVEFRPGLRKCPPRALLSGADENSLPQMYDRLCDGQEKAFAFAVKACRENPEMLTGSAALNMALLACASKTMSQRMLEAAPAEPEAK